MLFTFEAVGRLTFKNVPKYVTGDMMSPSPSPNNVSLPPCFSGQEKRLSEPPNHMSLVESKSRVLHSSAAMHASESSAHTPSTKKRFLSLASVERGVKLNAH